MSGSSNMQQRSPRSLTGGSFGLNLCDSGIVSGAMTYEPTQINDCSLLLAEYRRRWVALTDDEVAVVAAAPTVKAALAMSVAKGRTRADPLSRSGYPRQASSATERLEREQSLTQMEERCGVSSTVSWHGRNVHCEDITFLSSSILSGGSRL